MCTFIAYYIGLFLGDLGGVGGYDGIAPKALYLKVVEQPGNDFLSQISEIGSIFFLSLAVIFFAVFWICSAILVFQNMRKSE